jgi:N-acetylglucosamine transport system permease protein
MRHHRLRFVTGFLAVPVLLYAYYVVYPYGQAVAFSLTEWGGFSPEKRYVGLANYRQILKDDLVKQAFWHNVFFLVTLPIITIVLALFLAFLLNVGGRSDRAGIRGVRGSSVYKVIFFFPYLLSMVLVSIMWGAMYRGDANGFLNGLFIKMGLVNRERPLKFTADPTPFLGVPTVLWFLLIIAVWAGTGFYMVLFSAAMQSVPKDIYEAALLDGATRSQTFFRVTIPLLRETVSTVWIYLGFIALDMYASVAAITNGGPNNSSQVLGSALNFYAFKVGKYGYACAIGIALAIFALLLAMVQLFLTRRTKIEY